MSEEPKIEFHVAWGAVRLEKREWARAIMPRAKWWQWRYKRERAKVAAMFQAHGATLHEA